MRETLQQRRSALIDSLALNLSSKARQQVTRSSARSEGSLGVHASGGLLSVDRATAETECGVCLKKPDPLAFGAMHPPVLAHVGTREIIALFEQRSASPRNQFTLTRSVAARPNLLTSTAATG
jgi:hypothetical protein